MREDREKEGVGMTSKELTATLLEAVEDFMSEGGSIGDAIGALKVVKMSLEMSFAASAKTIIEEEEQ